MTETYYRVGSGGTLPPETIGVWGEGHSRWTIFYNSLEKIAILNAIGSHFACVLSHLKELDF